MRRGYIDWLRGVSVLIMIEAHTLDAWTRLDARHNSTYGWAMIVGGFAAPGFLFLAGLAIALAAGSRLRRGLSDSETAALARRRALQIFGLAFLFRLQSWLISGGDPVQALLKVDILNIMGLSMLAAALLWSAGRARWDRAAWMLAATVAVAMITPVVRATPLISPLPDPIEWYIRPIPGRGTFTLFPWAGFLLAALPIGIWLDTARTPDAERRVNIALAVIGLVVAAGGYAASYLPAIYRDSSFWTTSPTFFFLRLGILILSLPVAYAWNALWTGRSVMQEFGQASLFVYWIHVELAYGVLSGPIHKSLTLGQAFTAYAIFTVALFGAAKLKNQIVDWWNTGRLQPSGAL
ncbi:MAG TPA: heparan-alpha-glucosaminide N-acetyltransferase domain-containing protein [Vicinamibacterales bacterium]